MTLASSNRFSFVAPIYDFLARAYSFGMIAESKRWQVQYLKEGERVLYAGAGAAEDAVLAAKAGARVTIVELSGGMLAQTKKRIKALKVECAHPIVLIHADVMCHTPEHPYDVVVANYFLNVFEPRLMQAVFSHLNTLLRVEGKFFIADFAPMKANKWAAMCQKLYFYTAVTVFRVVAGNGWHPLYDYSGMLVNNGFRIDQKKDFRLGVCGPAWYRSIIASKH
jgi:demethylmenaquinone methyltransferase/2-methoxy-6-polyprenyl-1,4-benzoquinol methylase